MQQTKTSLVNCEAIAEAEDSKKPDAINPELSPYPESCTMDKFDEEVVDEL